MAQEQQQRMNPFRSDNMPERGTTWAKRINALRQHINTDHADASIDAVCKQLVQYVNSYRFAMEDRCGSAGLLLSDYLVTLVGAIFLDTHEELVDNEERTSIVLERFDEMITAQRHLLQSQMWEQENEG